MSLIAVWTAACAASQSEAKALSALSAQPYALASLESASAPASLSVEADKRLRLGIAWDAHEAWRALNRTRVAKQECELFAASAASIGRNDWLRIMGDRAAAEARLALLLPAQQALDAKLSEARGRYAERLLSAQAWDQMHERATRLQLAVVDAKAELARVTRAAAGLPENPPDAPGKELDLAAQQSRLERERLELRAPPAWNLELRAGVQRRFPESAGASRWPLFAAAELKIGLLSPLSGFYLDDAETAFRVRAQADPDSPANRGRRAAQEREETLALLKEKGVILRERLSELASARARTHATEGGSELNHRLEAQDLETRVELATIEARLQVYGERLPPLSAQSAAIPPPATHQPAPAPAPASAPDLSTASHGAVWELEATSGRLREEGSGTRRSEGATFRARAPEGSGNKLSFRFRIANRTREKHALAGGETRHQFGTMLRARDQCNALYAMIRLDKDGLASEVVVQTKLNPKAKTHAACGNEGYRGIKGIAENKVPPLEDGREHALEASVSDQELRLEIDGKNVWQGKVPLDGLADPGYAGIRADNLELVLMVPAPTRGAAPALAPTENPVPTPAGNTARKEPGK